MKERERESVLESDAVYCEGKKRESVRSNERTIDCVSVKETNTDKMCLCVLGKKEVVVERERGREREDLCWSKRQG